MINNIFRVFAFGPGVSFAFISKVTKLLYNFEYLKKLLSTYVILLILFSFQFFSIINHVKAQAVFGQVIRLDEIENYHRMVIQFEPMPEYDVFVDNGVLTVSFKQKVDLDFRKFRKLFTQKFSSVRIGPNSKTINFALKSKIKVNTMEAGRNLYIDLLPNDWQGAYPSLPRDVINALSERLRDAENNLEVLRHGEPPKELERVELYASDLQEFSRLRFDWLKPIQFEVKQKDNLVRIEFARKAMIDIGELKVNPPFNIGDADFLMDLRKTILLLKLREGVKARYVVRDGRTIIVDFYPDDAGNSIRPRSDLFEEVNKDGDQESVYVNNRSEARIDESDIEQEDGFEQILPDRVEGKDVSENSNSMINGLTEDKIADKNNLLSADMINESQADNVVTQDIIEDEEIALSRTEGKHISYEDLENLDTKPNIKNDELASNNIEIKGDNVKYLRSEPLKSETDSGDDFNSAGVYEKNNAQLAELIGEVSEEVLSNDVKIEPLDDEFESKDTNNLGDLNGGITIEIIELPSYVMGRASEPGSLNYEDFDQNLQLDDFDYMASNNVDAETKITEEVPSPEDSKIAKQEKDDVARVALAKKMLPDNGTQKMETKPDNKANISDIDPNSSQEAMLKNSKIKLPFKKPDNLVSSHDLNEQQVSKDVVENIGVVEKIDDLHEKKLEEYEDVERNIKKSAKTNNNKGEQDNKNVYSDILSDANVIGADISSTDDEFLLNSDGSSGDNEEAQRNIKPGSVKISDSEIGIEIGIDIDPKYIGHSVFKRGNNIYVVMDSTNTMDLGSFDKFKTHKIIINIENEKFNNWQYLKFTVIDNVLFSVKDTDDMLVLLIGNPDGRPIGGGNFKREINSQGMQQLAVKLPNIKSVRWINDDIFDDEMAVVTVTSLSIGMISRKEFVDFALLPTEVGGVVLPYSDNVDVQVRNEHAYISKPDGLNISLLKDNNNKSSNLINKYRTDGFEFLAKFNSDIVNKFNLDYYQNELIEKTASDDKNERVNSFLLLSKVYLNKGFGAEGLAYLNMAEHDDRKLTLLASHNAMKAYANYLEARYDDMKTYLNSDSLINDPHLSFWQGLLDEKENRFEDAYKKLYDNKVLDNFYPDLIKKAYQFSYLNSAINTDNLQEAELSVIELGRYNLSEHEQDRHNVLKAEFFMKAEDDEQANRLLDDLINTEHRDIEVKARYLKTLLDMKANAKTDDELIDELENLRTIWHGDKLEYDIINSLVRLYEKKKDYLNSFSLMSYLNRHVVGVNKNEIFNRLKQNFNDLFAKGEFDKIDPLSAVSLFYQNKELTPSGIEGDRMIRKLVSKLVSLDLLSQAIELMEHQVFNRFKGLSRSSAATLLAWIYLLDSDPEKAFDVIRRSRLTKLPTILKEKRRFLEAMTLLELGEYTNAVSIIEFIDKPHFEFIKAEAYWNDKNWQMAAEVLEKISDDFLSDGNLSKEEASQILRSTYSYVLADDIIGINRVRRKFLVAMETTAFAEEFYILISNDPSLNSKFVEMQSKFGSKDLMSVYEKNYHSDNGDIFEEDLKDEFKLVDEIKEGV